jgi:hypothetical protein
MPRNDDASDPDDPDHTDARCCTTTTAACDISRRDYHIHDSGYNECDDANSNTMLLRRQWAA